MSTIYRGATLDVSLNITDVKTGLPVDLTGAAVKFRLGQGPGYNATKEYAMTTGAGGTATLTITATDTLGYNSRSAYTYTVHVTETSGRVFIAAQGQIAFTDTVLVGM